MTHCILHLTSFSMGMGCENRFKGVRQGGIVIVVSF